MEGKYRIVKDIPVGRNGEKISAGLDLYLSNGVFYMDGGMLDKDFQEDFRKLLTIEMKKGWNYLRPVKF